MDRDDDRVVPPECGARDDAREEERGLEGGHTALTANHEPEPA